MYFGEKWVVLSMTRKGIWMDMNSNKSNVRVLLFKPVWLAVAVTGCQ